MCARVRASKMTSLRERTLVDLKAVVGDLVESLTTIFCDCAEMCTWCASLNEGVDRDGDALDEFLRRVTSLLTTSVPLKMVKYDRAVLSITGNPLNVYQLVMYKDLATVEKVFPAIKALELPIKVRTLSDSDAATFWRFVHEATQLTLRATETLPPVVPTTAQIAENIERRRRQRDQVNHHHHEGSASVDVANGVDDLWKELCHTRGVPPVPMTDALAERVARVVTAEADEETLRAQFPELGSDAYSEDSLAIARRIGSLCVMKRAIPTNMMHGIERVASSLVRDINSGKVDFANLDVEKIGEQVLQGVGEGDVGEFANNLERILPALQSMGGGLRK